MTVQHGANLYTQGFGSRPENVEIPHIDVRPPGVTDVNYPIGKRWIDQIGNAAYTLTSVSASLGTLSANWALLGTDTGALIRSLEPGMDISNARMMEPGRSFAIWPTPAQSSGLSASVAAPESAGWLLIVQPIMSCQAINSM